MKLLIDPVGNTMNIWWGNPQDVVVSEETDDLNRNDVLLKDKNGVIVGVEIIGLLPSELNVSHQIAEQFKTIFGNSPRLLKAA